MRNRGMRRSFALRALILACLVSGVSLGVSGAFASGRHAGDLGDQIAKCQKDLRDAQDELRYARDLQALFGRKTKVPPALKKVLGDELPAMILVTSGGFGSVASAIDVQAQIKLVLLKYAEGKVTARDLSRFLVSLAVYAGRTKRALAVARRDAQNEVNNLRAHCAALIAKQNGTTSPPPAQAGPFALVSRLTEIKNPNGPEEVKIDAAGGTAVWNHTGKFGGAGKGGEWKVAYTFNVPQALTPGKSTSVTLGMKVTDVKPEQPNSYQMSVLAPDFAQALNLSYPDRAEISKTFTIPISESFKDVKEMTITIGLVSATVIYHYRRG
jgi:hypothetical protein